MRDVSMVLPPPTSAAASSRTRSSREASITGKLVRPGAGRNAAAGQEGCPPSPQSRTATPAPTVTPQVCATSSGADSQKAHRDTRAAGMVWAGSQLSSWCAATTSSLVPVKARSGSISEPSLGANTRSQLPKGATDLGLNPPTSSLPGPRRPLGQHSPGWRDTPVPARPPARLLSFRPKCGPAEPGEPAVSQGAVGFGCNTFREPLSALGKLRPEPTMIPSGSRPP